MPITGIGKAIRGFGRALKSSKSPKTLKVKPLAERRLLGGGQTEKIMGGLQEVKKKSIEVQQAANKNRMKYSGYEGGKTKPLRSGVKDDIRIARDARKRRAKTTKEAAVGATAAGTATGGALYAADKVMKKKKKKEKK